MNLKTAYHKENATLCMRPSVTKYAPKYPSLASVLNLAL